jgi:predicted Ser/Thr protein kinase
LFVTSNTNTVLCLDSSDQKASGTDSEIVLPEVVTRRSFIQLEEITIEKEVGEGSYGKVCLGKWNGTPVALKFCRAKGKLDEFKKEMKLMR